MADYLVWKRCACHCWPMQLSTKAWRCGECDELADQPCQEPLDGKAYRI